MGHLIIENELTENQLNILEEAFEYEDRDLKMLLEQWMEHEKLKLKQFLAWRHEINNNGETRFSRSCKNVFTETMNIQIPKRRFNAQWTKLGIVFSCFWMPTTPQALAEQIDSVYDRIYHMSLKELGKEDYHLGFEMNWSYSVKRFFYVHLQSCKLHVDLIDHWQFYRNVDRIYIALRKYKNKYGFWPDTLNQLAEFTTKDTLVDPFNESSFTYQKTEYNFILYSKGKNGIDEKGCHKWPKYDPNEMSWDDYNKRGPEQDEILLWPEESE